MKLWQKIYLVLIVLFLITFNIVGFAIIQKNYNESIDKEIQNSLKQHDSIAYAIDMNFNLFNDYAYVIDYIKKETIKNDIKIEFLTKDNDILFSNLGFDISSQREELKSLTLYKKNYILRRVEEREYIFVSSLINVNDKNFKFSYVKNIDYIYNEKNDDYNFLLKFEIYILLIFAIIIYFISRKITSPIDSIIESTQNISSGNYDKRLDIKSLDELGILSSNFNVMADKIEEKILELQNINDEKQRFIDNLTHEIKTPLTSIIGYSNLLLTTKVDEKIQYESLKYINSEGKRLQELSSKMMNLICLNADNFEMKNENIMEILKYIKESFRIKLNEKNINLIINGKDCNLYIEKDLMTIMISNLVDNAIKASCNNSNIYLNSYKENLNTIIELRDTGIGISKEHIDKIIEPFYMVDKSRSRKNNGAGIGLSICKKIADIHNADIEIESEINKGTTIRVIFK
ncbi:sensor histidine kinase [Tepidibacter hydrothermalis]|uniref:histidine kinase n=1 Tax=Tepidibacter hydrothermalis TaxID=3036126 RepID=A0ABY8EAQ0_9FIRM|nr:HAMP domain-containing sensor histidine kinase [Tepidibacter hydrothermalis]WFD10012.1 HAMP domain-containing sensor histidine kinase [Tepidibacter hydrothermalis]